MKLRGIVADGCVVSVLVGLYEDLHRGAQSTTTDDTNSRLNNKMQQDDVRLRRPLSQQV
jgi:hypothetical protein